MRVITIELQFHDHNVAEKVYAQVNKWINTDPVLTENCAVRSIHIETFRSVIDDAEEENYTISPPGIGN